MRHQSILFFLLLFFLFCFRHVQVASKGSQRQGFLFRLLLPSSFTQLLALVFPRLDAAEPPGPRLRPVALVADDDAGQQGGRLGNLAFVVAAARGRSRPTPLLEQSALSFEDVEERLRGTADDVLLGRQRQSPRILAGILAK